MKLQLTLLLVVSFVAVYWQAVFEPFRRLLGTQPDLLPSLVVYAALAHGMPGVLMVALSGGLFVDSLSMNPLGASILPLFAAGLAITFWRDLVLREETFAQMLLGAAASAFVAVISLLLLLTAGHTPALGWGTLWQLAVMTAAGAVATPLWFAVFAILTRAFSYTRLPENAFRPDREIRRGR